MKALSGEFALLVVIAFCGFGAVSPVLSVAVGVAGLLSSSWPKYFELWTLAKEVGRLGTFGATLGLSFLNALVAVLASYGLGMVMRMLSTTV